MKILTDEQASVISAFHDAFDLYTTGAWAAISEAMESEFGIEDPEKELEAALKVIRGEVK